MNQVHRRCLECGCAGLVMTLAVLAASAGAIVATGDGVQIEQKDTALDVTVGGKLFTRYVFAGAPKPYCWPVIGPHGDAITRAFPMQKIDGEKHDHPHQRSLWFTHGIVNGVDFWAETEKSGKQVHRKFELVESGEKVGRVRTVNDWLGPDGKKVCEDTRELRFYAPAGSSDTTRVLDYDMTVRATEGPLTFGDTKEGSFGVRVATSMDVDQPNKKPGGKITNSRGEIDAKAWGKPAEWVDYSGLVNGKMVGVTIMNHPSSFRHPTHWHVRTYGLFAANPFGLHDFYNDKTKDGSHTVPKGESITFRFRVVFHAGDVESAKLADGYAKYVKSSDTATLP